MKKLILVVVLLMYVGSNSYLLDLKIDVMAQIPDPIADAAAITTAQNTGITATVTASMELLQQAQSSLEKLKYASDFMGQLKTLKNCIDLTVEYVCNYNDVSVTLGFFAYEDNCIYTIDINCVLLNNAKVNDYIVMLTKGIVVLNNYERVKTLNDLEETLKKSIYDVQRLKRLAQGNMIDLINNEYISYALSNMRYNTEKNIYTLNKSISKKLFNSYSTLQPKQIKEVTYDNARQEAINFKHKI